MVSIPELDAVFAAPLRGEASPWPVDWLGDEVLETVRRRLIYHGISGLLFERRHLLDRWPEVLLATVRAESMTHAMWELRHEVLISEVVEALHEAGIASVLLKGTALAYSFYDNPAHRFRGDSDLLIGKEDLEATRETLPTLGWQPTRNTHGPFGDMHYQEVWQSCDQSGLSHDLDLHWEVTNSRALRSVLDVHDVLEHSCRLPKLSPHARCADPVTALIHLAINRAVHARSGYFAIDRKEYDPNRLSWAVDIDLLAKAISNAQWDTFADCAVDRGVAPICLDALELAARMVGTPIPEDVSSKLARANRQTPALRFLEAKNDWAISLANLKATPGLLPRCSYVLARLMPAAQHLRAKYPQMKRWPLGVLYLRRILEALGYGQSRAAARHDAKP